MKSHLVEMLLIMSLLSLLLLLLLLLLLYSTGDVKSAARCRLLNH